MLATMNRSRGTFDIIFTILNYTTKIDLCQQNMRNMIQSFCRSQCEAGFSRFAGFAGLRGRKWISAFCPCAKRADKPKVSGHQPTYLNACERQKIGLRGETFSYEQRIRTLCARTKSRNSRLFLSSEKKAIGICLLQAGGKYQRRTHQVGGEFADFKLPLAGAR